MKLSVFLTVMNMCMCMMCALGFYGMQYRHIHILDSSR